MSLAVEASPETEWSEAGGGQEEEALERRSVGGLTLLREDLSLFKEGLLKAFKDKDSAFRPTQPSNALTLLREDLNSLRDDLSSVFRIGASREDAAAAAAASGSDEPVKSLFRRSLRKTAVKPEPEETKMPPLLPPPSDLTTDGGSTAGLLLDEETMCDVKEEEQEAEESQSEPSVPQDRSESSQSVCESSRDQETVPPSSANQGGDGEADESTEASRDGSAGLLSWDTLASAIQFFSLTDANKDHKRDQPGGDVWSLKNFACYLTLDPNSANAELRLSGGNRTATRVWPDHRSSEHPERFERCPQVLCREGLLDSVYWEVVWSGGADVGVAYNNICRDGEASSCLLGHNERSWSLECSEGSYTPCHNRRRFRSSRPQPFSRRVGVYLDWSAGALSFYCVSPDAMTHLHTFTAAFTEPLYPGFWVWAYDGSVSLCQVELDWERLLQ